MERPWRDPWLVIVVLLAAGMRLAHLFDLSRLPIFDSPSVDAALYVETARRFALDHALPDVFFKPPLYPLLLGLWYPLAAGDMLTLRLPGVLLGAATAGLTYVVGRQVFGRKVAVAGGLLQALHHSAVFFDTELLEIGLVSAVQMAALAMVLAASRESAGRRLAGITGWTLGLGCVARPTFVPFALAAVWGVGSGRRMATALGLVLAIAPVTAHNLVRGGDLVPISANGGMNFYLGNNPAATGRVAAAPELPARPAEAARRATELAERDAGRALRPSEVSRYWFQRGLAYLGAHPEHAVQLAVRKLFYALSGATLSDNQDLAGLDRYLRVLPWTPVRSFWLVPLGLVGLLVAARRDRRTRILAIYVALQVAAVLPFFVVERFRMPWTPVLALTAAWLLLSLPRRLRLVLPGAAALVVLNLPLWGARDPVQFDLDYRIAYAYQRQGDDVAAMAAYREAIRRNPRAALARNALGYLLAQRGERLDEARSLIEAAIRLDPQHAGNYFDSLAFVLLRGGDPAAAVAACDTGLTRTTDARARAQLQRRRAEAAAALNPGGRR